MLTAVWALLVLGAPALPAEPVCGGPQGPGSQGPGSQGPGSKGPAPHRMDCTACCPCVLDRSAPAVLSDVPDVPAPRHGILATPAVPPDERAEAVKALPPRARGPPERT